VFLLVGMEQHVLQTTRIATARVEGPARPSRQYTLPPCSTRPR
jgi:hypothetical protein